MRATAGVYKAELHWASIIQNIDDEHKEEAKEIRNKIVDLRRDMEPDSYFGDSR